MYSAKEKIARIIVPMAHKLAMNIAAKTNDLIAFISMPFYLFSVCPANLRGLEDRSDKLETFSKY